MIKKTPMAFIGATALLCGFVAQTSTQSFDMKDPKGVNSVQWLVESRLEPIAGSANGISGDLVIDTKTPSASRGKIIIATASMKAPVDLMTDHLRGNGWLDAAKYPTIEFTLKKLSKVKRKGDEVTAVATGDFSLHGVTKEITVPVQTLLIKGGSTDRTHGAVKGDLVRIRAEFKVKRSDFNISKGTPTFMVADDIEIRVAIVGTSATK